MGSDKHQHGDWDREQMDINPTDGTAAPDTAPEWDKAQVEAAGLPDDDHSTAPADGHGEGDSELSGHGNNPGGGKRFADKDQ